MSDKTELEAVATFDGLYLIPLVMLEGGTELCRLADANRLLAERDAEITRLFDEMAGLNKALDKFRSQSHGIPALAEIEKLRSRVSELEAKLAAPPAQAKIEVPDECPHLIVFDDQDREQLLFAGSGARDAARKAWENISMSWNAHLFVRIERNSRDDICPSARVAPAAPAAN